MRQFGTGANEYAPGVGLDASANAVLTGWTGGALNGTNYGGIDAFTGKYDSSGRQVWVRQLGTSWDDLSYRMAVDDVGNARIAGVTSVTFTGVKFGANEAVIAKYLP